MEDEQLPQEDQEQGQQSEQPSGNQPNPQSAAANNPNASSPNALQSARNVQHTAKNIQQTAQRVQKLAKTVSKAKNAAGAIATILQPEVLIPVLIIILILIILVVCMVFISGQLTQKAHEEWESQQQYGQNPLKISKTGPSTAANGTDLSYDIAVTYTGQAEDIIVTDPIPEGARYVSSNPEGTMLDANDNLTTSPSKVVKITWSLRQIQSGTAAPTGSPPASGDNTMGFISQLLTITLRPKKSDVYIVNTATASLVNPYAGDTSTINTDPISANNNDCNGYYTGYRALKKKGNFGDPECTMLSDQNPQDKDKLYGYIKKLDPADADIWFFTIIYGESLYNANAYGYGAGLFQMDTAPGSVQYKNGDVQWAIQATNAMNYSKWYTDWYQNYYHVTCPNAKWHYWETAKQYWSCGVPF